MTGEFFNQHFPIHTADIQIRKSHRHLLIFRRYQIGALDSVATEEKYSRYEGYENEYLFHFDDVFLLDEI
jgi:hypothetical protein